MDPVDPEEEARKEAEAAEKEEAAASAAAAASGKKALSLNLKPSLSLSHLFIDVRSKVVKQYNSRSVSRLTVQSKYDASLGFEVMGNNNSSNSICICWRLLRSAEN